MRIGGLRQLLGPQDGWKRWKHGDAAVRKHMFILAANAPHKRKLTIEDIERMMRDLWERYG